MNMIEYVFKQNTVWFLKQLSSLKPHLTRFRSRFRCESEAEAFVALRCEQDLRR